MDSFDEYSTILYVYFLFIRFCFIWLYCKKIVYNIENVCSSTVHVIDKASPVNRIFSEVLGGQNVYADFFLIFLNLLI